MKSPNATSRGNAVTLCLGHSPDADDAFMWWPITPRREGGSGFQPGGRAPLQFDHVRFEPVLADIESLNERSLVGDLDITAISCAQYPHVKDRYAIASCGGSFGRNYGPKLVARSSMTLDEIRDSGFPMAVPGLRTTAAMVTALALECGMERFAPAPFDAVINLVSSGEFEAGVVIHEGQLTFQQSGLHSILDLGEWWQGRFALPLPLGVNVVRRDLEDRVGIEPAEVVQALHASVLFALRHRDRALEYAKEFGRGISAKTADQFVEMYVNSLTVDGGGEGVEAIRTLLGVAHRAGLVPDPGPIDMIRPATGARAPS